MKRDPFSVQLTTMMKSLLQNILPHTGWSDSHKKSKVMISETLSLRRKRSHRISVQSQCPTTEGSATNPTYTSTSRHQCSPELSSTWNCLKRTHEIDEACSIQGQHTANYSGCIPLIWPQEHERSRNKIKKCEQHERRM